jgi:hypothetical protein
LATLWQICNRLSEVIGNPLTILQRVLATFANNTYLPEGFQHPLILGQRVLLSLQSNCQRVLDNLYRHLQEGCPINKERGNLFAIPLKKLEVKIKIQEATDSFKNCKRFISNKVLSLFITCSSSQSRETVPLMSNSLIMVQEPHIVANLFHQSLGAFKLLQTIESMLRSLK